MSVLNISKQQNGEVLTVVAEGRIDSATSVQFDSDIRSSLEGITSLIMEFGKLSYISSADLRVLLSFHKIMIAKGGSLVIKNPTKMVTEVFQVTGFGDVLNIE